MLRALCCAPWRLSTCSVWSLWQSSAKSSSLCCRGNRSCPFSPCWWLRCTAPWASVTPSCVCTSVCWGRRSPNNGETRGCRLDPQYTYKTLTPAAVHQSEEAPLGFDRTSSKTFSLVKVTNSNIQISCSQTVWRGFTLLHHRKPAVTQTEQSETSGLQRIWLSIHSVSAVCRPRVEETRLAGQRSEVGENWNTQTTNNRWHHLHKLWHHITSSEWNDLSSCF